MTPVDVLRRERRRRRVLRLSKRAGAWPLSVLIAWFVVEAAQKLAPDDPLPSLEEAARDLLCAATNVTRSPESRFALRPPPALLLATAMEGVVSRFLRDRDDRALLRDAVDVALAFEGRWAGSRGRHRGTPAGAVAHI